MAKGRDDSAASLLLSLAAPVPVFFCLGLPLHLLSGRYIGYSHLKNLSAATIQIVMTTAIIMIGISAS